MCDVIVKEVPGESWSGYQDMTLWRGYLERLEARKENALGVARGEQPAAERPE